MADGEYIHTAADFLGWALRSGWSFGVLPVSVVFTFQTPVTRTIGEAADVSTGAAVVVSDVHRVDRPASVDRTDTLPGSLDALDAAIETIRSA